mmetsp:Transcript_45432/g.120867  ORF Transcript_45432/g.120867 Transcript_45432/m.120867 type:complete len:118 (+) Transcript_45432:221-574(+)
MRAIVYMSAGWVGARRKIHTPRGCRAGSWPVVECPAIWVHPFSPMPNVQNHRHSILYALSLIPNQGQAHQAADSIQSIQVWLGIHIGAVETLEGRGASLDEPALAALFRDDEQWMSL